MSHSSRAGSETGADRAAEVERRFSHSLRRRANARNVSTSSLPYGGITYLINSFDYPNLLCFNSPPTQHQFLLKLFPLFSTEGLDGVACLCHQLTLSAIFQLSGKSLDFSQPSVHSVLSYHFKNAVFLR